MKEIFAKDARGNFVRNLGWKKADGEYKQPRFYFGKDRATALIRALQLEQVWDKIVERWQGAGTVRSERPLWDADTLAIGQAIARGDKEVTLNHEIEGFHAPLEVVAAWFISMRKDFPHVTINLADQNVQETGMKRLEKVAETSEETAKWIRGKTTTQTLYQALDAFSEWIRETCVNVDKTLSPHGASKLGQVKMLQAHIEDMPLSAYDLNAVASQRTHWANRPISKRSGKPMSVAHCQDMLKRVREFHKWLHRNPAFSWRRPEDYDDLPKPRIPTTREEMAARFSPHQVKTYTTDQLAILYQYATPVERLYFLLAMNCGFGVAEVSGLMLGEIFLDERHAHYGLVGSFIKRMRFKSAIYGEWKLWDATVAGIKWYLSRRPTSKENVLLLTEKGRPLNQQTKSGNRGQRLQNVWAKLRERIAKDHKTFPELSFNKLRKTASDLVKKFSDGETAGVFLSHGQTVKSDDLSDVYANRHYDKVFAAQNVVAAHLAAIFAKVEDPFPEDYKKRHPSISLGTIQKIKTLRAQGKTMIEIGQILNMPRETVRYYCKG